MSETKVSPFPCPLCEKEYMSNSGLWKHTRKYHPKGGLEATETTSQAEEPVEAVSEPVEDGEVGYDPFDSKDATEGPEWLQYESPTVSGDEESVTDSIPREIKFAHKMAETPAKAFSRDTNKSLLMVVYGATDTILSNYARVITAGEIETISHSQADKEWTADVTVDWLESSGYDLSNHITPGLLCLGANAYYVGQPMVRIQRSSKVELGAEVGSLASRIPILGRWLANRASKRKSKKGLGQNPPPFDDTEGWQNEGGQN